MSCRKMLLDSASAVVLNSKQPPKAFPHFEVMAEACTRALRLSECQTRLAVAAAADPALEALDALEKTQGYDDLFRHIRQFGSRLHVFLEISARHCHDLRCDRSKRAVVAKAEAVRKLLPVVIQSLRESLRHPMNSHARSNRAYFFRMVRRSVEAIVAVFRDGAPAAGEENVGQFVRALDAILEVCEGEAEIDEAAALDVADKVEWLVRFALAVSKVSDAEDDTVSFETIISQNG